LEQELDAALDAGSNLIAQCPCGSGVPLPAGEGRRLDRRAEPEVEPLRTMNVNRML
jgi:hypothetical protein